MSESDPNYMTADELRQTADIIEKLNGALKSWHAKDVSIDLDLNKSFPVRDTNGDILGSIGVDDSGEFAFFHSTL